MRQKDSKIKLRINKQDKHFYGWCVFSKHTIKFYNKFKINKTLTMIFSQLNSITYFNTNQVLNSLEKKFGFPMNLNFTKNSLTKSLSNILILLLLTIKKY